MFRRSVLALITAALVIIPSANAFAAGPIIIQPRPPVVVGFGNPSPKALGELKVILDNLVKGKISADKAALLIRLWAMRYGATLNMKWNGIVQDLLDAITRWSLTPGKAMTRHKNMVLIVAEYYNKLSQEIKNQDQHKPRKPALVA